MYSLPKHDYTKHSKSISTAAILTLESSKFPQLSKTRSQHDPTSGKFTGNYTSKKSHMYKSTSIRNQRVPNSTPEPNLRVGNDKKDKTHGDTHMDLVPHVASAQVHQSNQQINRQNDTKRVGIKDDTSDAQTSNTQANHNAIAEDRSTHGEGDVVTSGNIKALYEELSSDESLTDNNEKRRNEKGDTYGISRHPNSAILIPGFVSETAEENDQLELASPEKEESEFEENSQEALDADRSAQNTRVQDNSVEEVKEIASPKVASDVLESTEGEPESQPDSKEDLMIETSTEEEKSDLQNSMEKLTVVVVSVTTDQGEDVNADIYEYPCNQVGELGKCVRNFLRLF